MITEQDKEAIKEINYYRMLLARAQKDEDELIKAKKQREEREQRENNYEIVRDRGYYDQVIRYRGIEAKVVLSNEKSIKWAKSKIDRMLDGEDVVNVRMKIRESIKRRFLPDSLVVSMIIDSNPSVEKAMITNDLIELKRNQILLKREIKKLKS